MKVFDRANIRHLVVLNSTELLEPKEIDAFFKFIERCLGCFKQLQSIRIGCEDNHKSEKFVGLETMMDQILATGDSLDKCVEDVVVSIWTGCDWNLWTWEAQRGRSLQCFVNPDERPVFRP
jgi:hypothetical protein